ncbi:MAG: DUF3553 domain-containing protein [Rhodobacterales bacterium 17-64-5]|nr:MAG: DUF3553 domain-containing protein [Rhodobacterales bacterium 17-64-5]
MLVRHPTEADWGLGQVQSLINGKCTVNFEHKGKVVLDTRHIDLIVDFSTGPSP